MKFERTPINSITKESNSIMNTMFPVPEQRTMMYQTAPQKQYPPSKIPPRGWRPLRKPIDFSINNSEKSSSSPVLNEMLAFEPHVPIGEQFRIIAEKRMIENQLSNQHQERINFFKSIVSPPKTLELPNDPVIEQMQPISIHCDPSPQEFTGTMFSVKEIESAQMLTQDDGVVTMRVIQHKF